MLSGFKPSKDRYKLRHLDQKRYDALRFQTLKGSLQTEDALKSAAEQWKVSNPQRIATNLLQIADN